MPTEEWKDLPNFPNYQVSTLGNVGSLNRVITDIRGRMIRLTGKQLRLSYTLDGYQIVKLSVSGVSWTCSVHELVAAAFLGEKPQGSEIHHRNFKRYDNRPENLAYINATDQPWSFE